MKIFKYKTSKGFSDTHSPLQVIRVEDSFVWAVVNPDSHLRTIDIRGCINKKVSPEATLDLLPVREKQIIKLRGRPDSFTDKDGLLYVGYEESDIPGFAGEYEIVLYKTGQEITEPLKSLVYLGCGKLFICQELCLYAFLKV